MRQASSGRLETHLSAVNLAEVLRHTLPMERSFGVDLVQLLQTHGVQIHLPDEAIARAAARLPCSLGDAFAAATAQVLRGRFHTTDEDLVGQLAGRGIDISHY